MTCILFAARTDGSDPRVQKEIATLLSSGFTLSVLVIDSHAETGALEQSDRLRLLPIELRAESHSLRKMEAILRMLMTSTVEIVSGRVDSVHLVDEEMIGIGAVAKICRKNVVLDLFDSVELKSSARGPLIRGILYAISRIAKALADTVFVTDKLRFSLLDERTKKKSLVVPNYPDPKKLKNVRPSEGRAERNGLFVGGTLYSGRGLDTVLRALEIGPDITVECAGWLYDSHAENFVRHERVTYHGVLTQQDAYKLSDQCVANVALYEPTNTNNIYASPNKVYDALCLGQYVFINSEVRISDWLDKSPLVRSFPYDSEQELFASYAQCRDSKLNRSGRHYARVFSWKACEEALRQAHQVDKGKGR